MQNIFLGIKLSVWGLWAILAKTFGFTGNFDSLTCICTVYLSVTRRTIVRRGTNHKEKEHNEEKENKTNHEKKRTRRESMRKGNQLPKANNRKCNGTLSVHVIYMSIIQSGLETKLTSSLVLVQSHD